MMHEFSADCQMMLVWFAGILGSQKVMQRHVHEVAARDEPFSINSYRPDGRVDSVLARVPVEKVIDAFSAAGEFERLYAKAFVVFTYQIWEEVARPRIAGALKVEDPNHVVADLMGEWRRLRNWLVHRTETTELDFFGKAKTLTRLGMKRNEPWLTADKVFALMQWLNRMQVEVNPDSLEFGLEVAPLDAATIAEAAKTLEVGEGMDIPATAAMYPSAVLIVFSDGPTATVHELDCNDKDRQFQSIDGADAGCGSTPGKPLARSLGGWVNRSAGASIAARIRREREPSAPKPSKNAPGPGILGIAFPAPIRRATCTANCGHQL